MNVNWFRIDQIRADIACALILLFSWSTTRSRFYLRHIQKQGLNTFFCLKLLEKAVGASFHRLTDQQMITTWSLSGIGSARILKFFFFSYFRLNFAMLNLFDSRTVDIAVILMNFSTITNTRINISIPGACKSAKLNLTCSSFDQRCKLKDFALDSKMFSFLSLSISTNSAFSHTSGYPL